MIYFRKVQRQSELVIFLAGNNGLYERSLTRAPHNAGHVTLAPNRPGYGCSTGVTDPQAEASAVTAVLEMCENLLKYKPHQTVAMGYSMGAFSSAIGRRKVDGSL